jgi:hypothetical protein
VAYLERYLIVIAGEGQGTDSKGKKISSLLNDVWCFDTERVVWESVEVCNRGIFKPRSCFSANLFKNKIYIFGGLISTENFRSSDELLVLSFAETTQKNLEVCNICKLHYQPVEPKLYEKENLSVTSRSSFQFGLGNLYKFSRMIKNPFDAICHIIEAYTKMNYRSMVFDLIEGKIVMVQGEGTEVSEENFEFILNKYEFVEEINSEDPLILSAFEQRKEQENLQIFSYNLKNACSRLGQSFMLINRRGVLIDLALITPENIFYCEYSTVDESVSGQQEKSYEIIRTYMHRNNLNITLIENAIFTVIITDLQRISPTQSELRVNGANVIEFAGSAKKVGLHNYCATLFLRKPNIKVSINNLEVEFRDHEVLLG